MSHFIPINWDYIRKEKPLITGIRIIMLAKLDIKSFFTIDYLGDQAFQTLIGIDYL